MVFGKNGNTWYIYQNVGAGRSLATITPVTGSTSEYTVEAWFSVGQNNATSYGTWYGGSYGELATDLTQSGTCTSVDSSSFELTSLGVTSQSTFGTGITLDGTSTDSVHFGYDVAGMSSISGVAKF